MRAYFFGNMYLSSIQQGIQALHCLGEMHNKYDVALGPGDIGQEHCTEPSTQLCQLRHWEEQHKTVVLLNAGFSEEIRDLHTFFHNEQNVYPFASFAEGEDALDGALTCTGIILPMEIYEGAKQLRRVQRQPMGTVDRQFLEEDRVLVFGDGNGGMVEYQYSEFEIDLMDRMMNYRLAQ